MDESPPDAPRAPVAIVIDIADAPTPVIATSEGVTVVVAHVDDVDAAIDEAVAARAAEQSAPAPDVEPAP